MFEAGDRARRDARTCLQAFGGDARQRRAAHLQPGVFPSLARHAEHRALARPGIADDDSKPAPVRHTLERGALLTRKLQAALRSEEHTSELQSLMRISYAVFCLQKKKTETHK